MIDLDSKSSLSQAERYAEPVEAEEPLIEQKEARGWSVIQFLRDRFHKAFLAGSLLAAASGCISSARPPKTFSTWKPDYQTQFEKREDKKLIVTGRMHAGYLQVLAVHQGKVFNVQRIVEREMEHVEIETTGLGLELGLAGASFAAGGLFIVNGKSLWNEAKQEKEEGYADTEDEQDTIQKALDARGQIVTGVLLLGAGLIASGHSIYTAIKARDSETMTPNMRNKDTVTSTRNEVFAAPNQPIHLQSGGNQFLLGYTSQHGGFQIPMSELHRVVDLSLVLVAHGNVRIVVGDASAIGEVSFEIPLENFAQAVVPKEEWDLYKKSHGGDIESAFRYTAVYPKGHMFKEVQSYADAVRKVQHNIELGLQAEGRNSYKAAQGALSMAKEILDHLKDKFKQDGVAFPTELAKLQKDIAESVNRIETKERSIPPPVTVANAIEEAAPSLWTQLTASHDVAQDEADKKPPSMSRKSKTFSPQQLLDQCEKTLGEINEQIGYLLTDLQMESTKLHAYLKDNFDDLDFSKQGNRNVLDFGSFDKCVLKAQRTKEVGGDFDPALTACFSRAQDAFGFRFGWDVNPNARILEQLDQCTNVLETSIGQRNQVRRWRRYIEVRTASVLKGKKRKKADHDNLVRERAERLRKLQGRSR